MSHAIMWSQCMHHTYTTLREAEPARVASEPSCVLRPDVVWPLGRWRLGRTVGRGRVDHHGDRANMNMRRGEIGPWYQVLCGVTERFAQA